ncbi:hypothetical protein Poli38472_005055 [Pythium oligandrum]|uniref:Glucosylceramidase n=1 Tax=Pythium oligandrum TaxID=41045 RepID=A0A8K1CFM8_PYTOL|nr:hypothetical protein Poli38472_005055 [Pythium oligandrum]|eukprot:TMW62437.1 hypothetical protein Poli38472_005055 [Pythium oligandrum]
MMRSWSFLAVLALGFVANNNAVDAACNNFSNRFQKALEGVCVCTEASCDTVSNAYLTTPAAQLSVYTTSKAGDRLAPSTVAINTTKPTTSDFIIEPTVTYQKMIGFGGAFTDAAAINIYKLKTTSLQQKVLDAYYAESGLQYTVGRIPISSSDFSTSIYSYNPVVDDFDMKHFSIDVDRAPNSNKLDLIKRALSTTKRELSIFASSWAPPTWMTRDNSTLNCRVKGVPGEPYWKALALYYARFIEEYQKEGINIWGITVQNEPGKPIIQPSVWQSLRLTPEEERDFIKKDLGPLLKQKSPDIKIIAHDDQTADIPDRMAPFKDADALKYIDGIGIHWYKNLDFFFFGLGGDYGKLVDFHNKYPDVFILGTEACEGYLPSWLGTGVGVKLQQPEQIWYRAENYARDIIEDVANFASGWTDWNLALDTNGGPNWAKNFVDSPIIIDEVSGTEFYKQPMYYILGHLSKFIPAGSIRINLKSNSKKNWDNIHRAAFLTPEKRVVVVFCNRRGDPATVAFETPLQQSVTVTIPARATQTYIFQASAIAK